MAGNLLWWACIFLETAVLVRGISSGLAKRYRLFYGYLIFILSGEVIRLISYVFAPDRYGSLYWYTELATVIASYAVILEILNQSLQSCPALSRPLTRLLWIIFALTLTYVCCGLMANGFVSVSRVAADLSRDLRIVEGALLLLMLWFFGRHRLSLGRNLRGITIGMTMWVGANVINLAFLSSPGHEFSAFLRELLPVTYLTALVLWCLSLWSVAPISTIRLAPEAEGDLAMVATKTRITVTGISERFLGVLRQ